MINIPERRSLWPKPLRSNIPQNMNPPWVCIPNPINLFSGLTEILEDSLE